MIASIFCLDHKKLIDWPIPKQNYRIAFWTPSLFQFIPPFKSVKYVLYWFFHTLHVFKNRDYSAILVFEGDEFVASMLIVPAHFKWPFMGKDDLQFTYVMTRENKRGLGIGLLMLRVAIRKYYRTNRAYWYITDSENHSSIRLCSKAGFQFRAFGIRRGLLKILKVQELTHKEHETQ